MTGSSSILRRYTDLASLLDMLQRRAITLLPPSTWDDGNDRLMMKTYKDCKDLETLLALCLTSRGETYHHWKVFTDRNNGVCVHFRRDGFKRAMRAAKVKVDKMTYLKLGQLDPGTFAIEELPFLKRLAFEDEGEVRAVYENKDSEDGLKRVEFSFDIIERVTLNPWMPRSVADSVRAIIEGMRAGAEFSVTQSALIDARGWREFAANYKKPDLA